MRRALLASLQRPGAVDAYPKGAIIICASCGHPIYRLERGLSVGEKASRMVDAFRPVTPADLEALAGRTDVDAGVRAICLALTPQQRKAYCDALTAPRMGQPAICPRCKEAFIQGRTVEVSDTTDRAFVWEPLAIMPVGMDSPGIRGGRIHGGRIH